MKKELMDGLLLLLAIGAAFGFLFLMAWASIGWR